MNRATLILTALLVGSITHAGVPFPRVAAPPRVTRASPVKGLMEPQGQRAEQAKRASMEFHVGRALLRLGDSAKALIHLDSALDLFRQTEDRRGEAAAHDLIGELYERQGSYEPALKHFNKAHEIFAGQISQKEKKPLSTHNAELMLAKIGQMNYRLGDSDGARAAFGRMSGQKPSRKMSAAAAASSIAGGLFPKNRAARTGASAAGAALTAKEEREYYRESIVYSARELGLGRVAYFSDKLDEAKKHFENALDVTKGDLASLAKFGQMRRFRAAAQTALGDIAMHGLDYKKAADLYEDAIKEAKKDERLDLTWPAEHGRARALGRLASEEKNLKKAKKFGREALDAYRDARRSVETLMQGSLRADEARTTFLATTSDVFVEASSEFTRQALASAGTQAGEPLKGTALELAAEAFEIVEAGRARSLLDLLSETGSSVTADVPANLLQIKKENLSRQEEVVAQLKGTDPSGEEPKDSLEKLETRLDELQTEYDGIENRIRAASPRYASLTSTRPLKLADVQRQVLDPETALLEYSLGEEASYLWVVTRDEVRLFKLPPRSVLSDEVEEMRRQMVPASQNTSILELTSPEEDDDRGLVLGRQTAFSDPQPFVSASHKLYRSVLAQAASLIGAKRLLVVGDGPLNYVPFAALVTDSKGTDYTNLPYLALTNEIVYAPSASVIDAVRRQAPPAAASDSILLIADPVFDPSDPRAAAANQPSPARAASRDFGLSAGIADLAGKPARSLLPRNAVIKRLPATASEAEQIARYAGGANLKSQVWRDLDASEANVVGDLSRYRVLHFATHGLLNAERPQFSGLILSLVGNLEGKDGFLRTDEVFNLRLGSPLVMLSACQSGLGKERRGEGVIGLTRAFLYAGAPTVGVTLWSVADRPTAKLMAAFYDNYLTKQGTKPAAAMQAAQRAMIADKNHAAPFYWASFILVGDY